MERVVALELELVDQLERGSGPLDLADRDRAVEGYDRRRGKREQLVVQGEDLRPVGVLESRGVGVDGVDSRLELIRARLVATNAPAYDRLTLLDQCPIPATAVLLGEQDERAVRPRPR